MSPILRRIRRALAVLLLTCISAPGAWASAWTADFPSSLREAKRDGKLVLVAFTGSDWCGWCEKLQSEVLGKAEFRQYASKKLVLVEVDFPHHKAISQSQLAQNQQLAQWLGIRAYPTLVLLDADAWELGRTGYSPDGASGLIAELERLRQAAGPKVARAQPGPGTKPAAGGAASPWNPQPVIARGKPKVETELRLKGISGVPGRRMALINGETLGPGDEVRVPVGDRMVRVHCLEVRDVSTVIQVTGEDGPRELLLKK